MLTRSRVLTRPPVLTRQSLMLYGPPGCGKTHVAHAIAAAAGANFLDISPANTDGKYPKGAQMLMHKVFKVARVMCPSVVYMDECEKVRRTHVCVRCLCV